MFLTTIKLMYLVEVDVPVSEQTSMYYQPLKCNSTVFQPEIRDTMVEQLQVL